MNGCEAVICRQNPDCVCVSVNARCALSVAQDTDAYRGALRSCALGYGSRCMMQAGQTMVKLALRCVASGLDSALEEGFIFIRQKNVELWKAT